MTRRGWFLGLGLLGLLGLGGLGGPAGAEPVATAHHTFTVVSASPIQARAASTARRFLGIINNSTSVVFCTVDDTVSAVNEGIRLAATGTTGDRLFFLQNVPSGAVNCVAATAGENRVLVIEGR